MSYPHFLFSMIILIGILPSCNSNNLGENIYLLEGDRREDRIIVECTGKSFGDCIAGEYLVPKAYDEHFKEGKYSEFVDSVNADNDYVIAITVSISNGIKSYWIIDKKKKRLRSTKDNLHSFVLGPLDFNSFLEERKKNGIRLNF